MIFATTHFIFPWKSRVSASSFISFPANNYKSSTLRLFVPVNRRVVHLFLFPSIKPSEFENSAFLFITGSRYLCSVSCAFESDSCVFGAESCVFGFESCAFAISKVTCACSAMVTPLQISFPIPNQVQWQADGSCPFNVAFPDILRTPVGTKPKVYYSVHT